MARRNFEADCKDADREMRRRGYISELEIWMLVLKENGRLFNASGQAYIRQIALTNDWMQARDHHLHERVFRKYRGKGSTLYVKNPFPPKPLPSINIMLRDMKVRTKVCSFLKRNSKTKTAFSLFSLMGIGRDHFDHLHYKSNIVRLIKPLEDLMKKMGWHVVGNRREKDGLEYKVFSKAVKRTTGKMPDVIEDQFSDILG